MRPELFPDDHSDIFRGGIEMLEFFCIQIQITMIERFLHMLLNELLEYFHIHYITRFRVNGSLYADKNLIIVPMIVGIEAFSEHLAVLLIRP